MMVVFNFFQNVANCGMRDDDDDDDEYNINKKKDGTSSTKNKAKNKMKNDQQQQSSSTDDEKRKNTNKRKKHRNKNQLTTARTRTTTEQSSLTLDSNNMGPLGTTRPKMNLMESLVDTTTNAMTDTTNVVMGTTTGAAGAIIRGVSHTVDCVVDLGSKATTNVVNASTSFVLPTTAGATSSPISSIINPNANNPDVQTTVIIIEIGGAMRLMLPNEQQEQQSKEEEEEQEQEQEQECSIAEKQKQQQQQQQSHHQERQQSQQSEQDSGSEGGTIDFQRQQQQQQQQCSRDLITELSFDGVTCRDTRSSGSITSAEQQKQQQQQNTAACSSSSSSNTTKDVKAGVDKVARAVTKTASTIVSGVSSVIPGGVGGGVGVGGGGGGVGQRRRMKQIVNPYCVITMPRPMNQQHHYHKNNRSMAVHKTKVIKNDEDPIWTVRTKSFCLLAIPHTILTTTNDNKNSSSSNHHHHNHNNKPRRHTTQTDKNNSIQQQQEQEHSELRRRHTTNLPNEVIMDPNHHPSRRHHHHNSSCHLNDSILIEVRSLGCSERLGYVSLTYDELLKGDGKRREYHLMVPDHNAIASSSSSELLLLNECSDRSSTSQNNKIIYRKSSRMTIALRFRIATQFDILFHGHRIEEQTILHKYRNKLKRLDSDINFHAGVVKGKKLFQQYNKYDYKNRQRLYRVQPGPDPDIIVVQQQQQQQNTNEWFTRKQINQMALEPSRRWITAGQGTAGVLFLEIIGCDNLVNMDGISSETDAFVVMLFEDTVVRTPVIWDDLHPRYMPWITGRAYAFNITHPTAILAMAVYDYDEPLTSVTNLHEPIGRVVTDINNFRHDTDYVLHYKLYHDPKHDINEPNNNRGTLIVRLRIQWNPDANMKELATQIPPRHIINVDNNKSYQVIRYLTKGNIDMDKHNMTTVKLYGTELYSYWYRYCYVLDVLFQALLWRGRYHIAGSSTNSIWFPINSIMILITAIFAVEYPSKLLPMLLYDIVFIMLSLNYYNSHHPNPWKKTKSYFDSAIFQCLFQSKNIPDSRPNTIKRGEGIHDGLMFEYLDEYRSKRMSALISTWIDHFNKVYKIYSKTTITSVNITTQDNRKDRWDILSNMLSDHLYYIHMLLKYTCQGLKFINNFINWRGGNYYGASTFTTYIFIIATIWFILPINTILHWIIRIITYGILGPHMKLIDICTNSTVWHPTHQEILRRLYTQISVDDVGNYNKQQTEEDEDSSSSSINSTEDDDDNDTDESDNNDYDDDNGEDDLVSTASMSSGGSSRRSNTIKRRGSRDGTNNNNNNNGSIRNSSRNSTRTTQSTRTSQNSDNSHNNEYSNRSGDDQQGLEYYSKLPIEMDIDVPDLDAMMNTSFFHQLGFNGRIMAEKLYKLKDMRNHMFGSYSVIVPTVDDSAYPSIPLSPSTAISTKETEKKHQRMIHEIQQQQQDEAKTITGQISSRIKSSSSRPSFRRRRSSATLSSEKARIRTFQYHVPGQNLSYHAIDDSMSPKIATTSNIQDCSDIIDNNSDRPLPLLRNSISLGGKIE